MLVKRAHGDSDIVMNWFTSTMLRATLSGAIHNKYFLLSLKWLEIHHIRAHFLLELLIRHSYGCHLHFRNLNYNRINSHCDIYSCHLQSEQDYGCSMPLGILMDYRDITQDVHIYFCSVRPYNITHFANHWHVQPPLSLMYLYLAYDLQMHIRLIEWWVQ